MRNTGSVVSPFTVRARQLQSRVGCCLEAIQLCDHFSGQVQYCRNIAADGQQCTILEQREQRFQSDRIQDSALVVFLFPPGIGKEDEKGINRRGRKEPRQQVAGIRKDNTGVVQFLLFKPGQSGAAELTFDFKANETPVRVSGCKRNQEKTLNAF